MLMLLLWFVLIAVLVYLVETYVPMDPMFRTVFRVLVALGLIIWLAQAFGLIGPFGPFHFSRI